MEARSKVYSLALWIIAISLVMYHGALAYYTFAPTTQWIRYHSVLPLNDTVQTNETLIFVSSVSLYANISVEFNDILFRWDADDQSYSRYSSQNTSRMYAKYGTYRITRWPYSPGPAIPGRYCLESNIKIHLPLNVERTLRFDGCEDGISFEVIN